MGKTRTYSIMTDPCHWDKRCPRCKKWFSIELKPPGTKYTNQLVTYCRKCINEKAAAERLYYSIPEYLKRKRSRKECNGL